MSEAITHYNDLIKFNEKPGLHISGISDGSLLEFYLDTPMEFENEKKYKSFIEKIAADLGLTVEEDIKSIRTRFKLKSDGEEVVYFYAAEIQNQFKLSSFGINRHSEKAKEAADYLEKLFSPQEDIS